MFEPAFGEFYVRPDTIPDGAEVAGLTKSIVNQVNRLINVMNSGDVDRAVVVAADVARTCRPWSDRLDEITNHSDHAKRMRREWVLWTTWVLMPVRADGADLARDEGAMTRVTTRISRRDA